MVDVSVPSFVVFDLAVDVIVPSLSCHYIDILRYYLYSGVLRLPVLPVCVFNVVRFDDLCLFSSSVVNLSGCDQALACTSNRTLYWRSLSFFSSHPSLALSLSLSPLLIPLLLSLSLSLSVNVGVHIVCVYTIEVIGSVEYERSVPH